MNEEFDRMSKRGKTAEFLLDIVEAVKQNSFSFQTGKFDALEFEKRITSLLGSSVRLKI